MFNPQKQLIEKVNNNKGFTLIEVMIAAVILAIGILGVAAMQAAAINGNNTGRSFTEATTLAQNWVEIIIRLPFNKTAGDGVVPNLFELQDGNGANNNQAGLDDGLLLGNAADFTQANIGPNGRYTIDFNYADNVVAPNTKTIRISVTWQDARGTQFPDTVRRRRAVFDFIKCQTTI